MFVQSFGKIKRACWINRKKQAFQNLASKTSYYYNEFQIPFYTFVDSRSLFFILFNFSSYTLVIIPPIFQVDKTKVCRSTTNQTVTNSIKIKVANFCTKYTMVNYIYTTLQKCSYNHITFLCFLILYFLVGGGRKSFLCWLRGFCSHETSKRLLPKFSGRDPTPLMWIILGH